MIFDKIKEYLVEEVGIEPEKVTMEASLVDDLDFDDIDIMEFLCFVSEEVDVDIAEDVPEHYRTIGDAVRYIEWLLE